MQATCTDQAVLSCGAVYNVVQGGFKVAPLDFLGGKLPPLNVYYVGINKNIRKRLPQLYKDKKVVMIHVLLTSELPWKQNASITFFTFLCISQ